MSNDITPTVVAMGELNFQGLILDHRWLHAIKFESGKTDVISCLVLAEIIYWYRPKAVLDEQTGALLGYRKKFKADKFQRSYQALADKLGLTKRQIKEAIDRLERSGFIQREFRTVETEDGRRLSNVLFLEPIPKRVKEITGPQFNPLPHSSVTPSYVSTQDPLTLERNTPPTPERRTYTRDYYLQDSPSSPPAREEKLSSQPGSAPREPKTPHDWAQYFIRRCGYRIDQVVYIPKAMTMFRQWTAEGITLEDVEDAALVAEAKLNGYPANPTFYRRFVDEVVLEKQRAKENPAATGNSQPGSYEPRNNCNLRDNYGKNRPISQRKLSAAERAIELEREYYRLRGEPDPYPRAERELFDITPACLRIN